MNQSNDPSLVSVWTKIQSISHAVIAIAVLFVLSVTGYKIMKFPSTQLGTQLLQDSKETHSLIADARASISEGNKNLLDARKIYEQQLPPLIDKLNRSADDSHALLQSLRGTSDAATSTLTQATTSVKQIGDTAQATTGQIQVLIDDTHQSLSKLPTLIETGTTTINDVDVFANNPDWRTLLHNSQSLVGHADAIAADGQIEADKLAHPNKTKLGFWGGTTVTLKWLTSHSPPLF